MPKGVKNYGWHHNGGLTATCFNMVGFSLIVLNGQVELL
jgi:hypothetical protein